MRKHKNLLTLLPALLIGMVGQAQHHKTMDERTRATEVAVWDTYVTRTDGRVMHFDIIAPSSQRDTTVIHGYGRTYLESKGQGDQALTARECRFCHVRSLRPQWESEIRSQGYFILEMENCD
ncbi:MAG: DUF2024 family protein [Flavobacteriales bacterium]|nr:DUF2024 family protein [Flavobacteriales bacterium]HPJ51343.1 DUF2024 family protein [Flavobacteriales bacterium]HPQ57851.1 DUF2024 family protein [Flavobacteriales bacterium]HRW88784.1 DUF2024 family protein [Flavobacteriales bacterium]